MKNAETNPDAMGAADTLKSIHLSASAGSGKTRALKQRYLALLDVLHNRGLGIDQAVAITFTDKAAAEIKERVLRDLPEAMLKKVIRGSEDVRISTIHSFCMNLLKRYPLEAGLPPDFGILDSRDQAAKMERAVGDTLEAADRNRALMEPLAAFTADELTAVLKYLLSIRSRIQRIEIDAGGAEELLRAVRAAAGAAEMETALQDSITSDDVRSALRRMESLLRNQGDQQYGSSRGAEHLLLARAENGAEGSRIARSLAPVYFTNAGAPRRNPFITKKAYSGTRSVYEALYFEIQEMLVRIDTLAAQIRAAREAVSMLRLFQLAEENYQNAKLREGLLDFDDLEICTYRLLQQAESPEILYWLDRRILHFLVDEFQDTSDIQWAILSRLTAELFAGQGTDKPVPSTLFVVGDEKQSIYRFREANYRLLEDVRRKMENNLPPEAREILTLDRNYRSSPEVVETVNKVFSALWGTAYTSAVAQRTAHGGSVRLIEIEASPATKASAFTEAAALAEEIRAMVAAGTIVYDRTPESGTGPGWTARAADYSDCAILIQSRTKLKEYEEALRAKNIPYRVLGGVGFYEEDEIQALMNVLFFLWNRDDTLALAAALKSPLFGLTDRDLFDLAHHQAGMVGALGLLQPAAAALLEGWMSIAGLVPLANLVHRVVQDSGAYVRFGRGNPQAVFNIDKLLDTARDFDRRGYTTLQDFVEWVKNIRRTEQREAAADMNLPGFRGSVSIMTVHKAKGLEYHIVFLPGMNQQTPSLSSGPEAIIEDDNGRIRMAVKDSRSPLYDALWDHERAELLREHQRLLYVAMTRARDHLVMTGTLTTGTSPIKPNTWLAYLHAAAPRPLFDSVQDRGNGVRFFAWPSACDHPHLQGPTGGAVSRSAMQIKNHKNQEPQSTSGCRPDPARLIANLAVLPRSDAPEWRKATDFISREESALHPPDEAAGTGPSPITRGSILHRCLEDVTRTGSYNLDAVMGEYAEMLSLTGEDRQRFSQEATALLQALLHDPDLAWIFEIRPRSYSELAFLYRKGRDIVSGIIDRVVINNLDGFVIDYKSIRVPDESTLAFWREHYHPQLQIYCEAVRQLFGLKRVTGYLLFLDSNKLVPCVEM